MLWTHLNKFQPKNMQPSQSGFLVRVVFVCVTLCEVARAKPPHIVFMVADDVGWNDIGFNNPDIISPNINKLAKSGVILNHAYVQPVCSPSRSAFMTSYYPFRLGLQHGVINPRTAACVPLDKVFLPEVLKKHGYSTHAVGKWHLGNCKWSCTATSRGFDSFFGYYSSREDYYTKNMGYGFDFHNNTDVYWKANGTYSSYLYAAQVEKIITAHDPNVPLFLYFPIQSVHEPLEVPDHYYKMYPNIKNKKRRILSGMVTALDDAVGHLVHSLQTKRMYDDTIIFFTSDNGGWIPYGGNNYPLRGGKITIWEGGTRVPAFVHGKPLTKVGVRYDGLMHAVDWFPTIVDAAGIKYDDPHRDGISMWKAITTLSPSNRTEFVYNLDNRTNPNQGHAAIRVGDFKLIVGVPGLYNYWYLPNDDWNDTMPDPASFDLDEQFRAMRRNWTLYRGLFDLKNDPYEHNNLYWQQPAIVDRLKARLSYHYQRMVPANYPPIIIKSNPRYWGGALTPGWCK